MLSFGYALEYVLLIPTLEHSQITWYLLQWSVVARGHQVKTPSRR